MMTNTRETPCQECTTDPPSLALLIQDGQHRHIVSLGKGYYSIGRDRDNDICLTSRGVSRHHASLVWLGDHYFIQDGLGSDRPSCNGLAINGKAMMASPLTPGDSISFCQGVRARLVAIRPEPVATLTPPVPMVFMPPVPGDANDEGDRSRCGLLEFFPDLILRFDGNGRILEVQTSIDPTLRLIDCAVGRVVTDCFDVSFVVNLFGHSQRAAKTRSLQSFEAAVLVNEQQMFCEVRLVPAGRHEHIAIIRNITERKRQEQALLADAIHDSLTGLPNRSAFMQKAAQALERNQKRGDYNFAVLFIDLDNFKRVNDSLGHRMGDQLLVEIALRLKVGLRSSDTVARLGGDEFAILLHDIPSVATAAAIADQIQESLSTPLLLDNQAVFPSASIGIALSDGDYDSVEAILHHADLAMYRAKGAGRSQHAVFDPTLDG
ncbi:GGDEF domain-containing protein [Leptolyngbya sp. KIOST-1]|uniref:GGDEF domain-containing protein n=1 Tax=Leptolyngbya sp. KIOST-1 TaxID=1229172 RepID=UPI00068C0D27|nr:GGDEF domain-containing protein [Leptolyngbya sp. KIOST-1]